MREPVTTIGWLLSGVVEAAGGVPGGWARADAGQAAIPAATAKVALPKRSVREMLVMTRGSPAGRAHRQRGPVRPTADDYSGSTGGRKRKARLIAEKRRISADRCRSVTINRR